MPQEIRVWEVNEKNELSPIKSSQIEEEKELEKWLENKVSVIDENLLVIGRQVKTGYGKTIDLLCIDRPGNLVVVELKKGKTPREVTTQALDYASWVKDLDFEQIKDIASKYFEQIKPKGSLEDAFKEKFGDKLPETLNLEHRSLIVAERMDAATERIVRYLSEFGVPINVATVQYFKDKNLLTRVFLVDPIVAQEKAQASSKRRKGYTTLRELSAKAKESGVEALYEQLREGIREIERFGYEAYYSRPNNLRCHIRNSDGKTRTVMYIDVSPSDPKGELKFHIYPTRFSDLWDIDVGRMKNLLPRKSLEVEKEDGEDVVKGTFRTKEEVDNFLGGLRRASI